MRRATAVLGLVCWSILATMAAAADEVRLIQVTPVQSGALVACRLQTEGLPGEKQLQSMRSGLVSAVELELALLDENDQLLAGNSLTLRMAFDLWDEVFSVRSDGRERRFLTLAEMQEYLADLSDLPVAPASLLGPEARYRLRVDLVVHAIAPDEQQRVAAVIAGERRLRREGQDQQEASVSLGRLIRMFYRGGGEVHGDQQQMSPWFTRKGLHDATH